MPKKTSNASLQAKLDVLNTLAEEGKKEQFVHAFVPLDLTPDELASYLSELTSNAEQWGNLAAEISSIKWGTRVKKILGDQITTATFCFPHPFYEQVDREVTFGQVDGEWRAEG